MNNDFLQKMIYILGSPSIEPSSRKYASDAGIYARKLLAGDMLKKYEKHLVSLATGMGPDMDVEHLISQIGSLMDVSSATQVQKQNSMRFLRKVLVPQVFECLFV